VRQAMRPCRYSEGTMGSKENILLLSAGRRVELLRAFKVEVKSRGIGGGVFATDMNPSTSAACRVADQAFRMPSVTDEGYLDELLKLCEEQRVGLVIPTIDTELIGLAAAKARFSESGIQIVISDEALVRTCRDKRQMAALFASLDIGTPALMDPSHLTFPCFSKPYDGSRSVGAKKLSAPSDLTDSMRNDPKLIFMEYIDSTYDEFTVDAYFDRNGTLKCLVPRHRLEVRDGEVSKGVTRRGRVYDYLKDRLKKIQGARGCLTVQLFASSEGSRYAALEINPRFGGGYPLSYAAGASFPGWLIDEYILGSAVSFFDEWQPDLLMLRYDAQVLVRDAI
jgi:carbamoyl-phosphate synthase large subunit